MSFLDVHERAVLDANLGAGATLLGATVDIGLSTTAPADDGTNITEPAGGAYARKTVNNDGAEWSAAATVGGITTKANINTIVFVQASGAAWGLISHWVLYDGGVPKIWGLLDDGTGTPLARQVNDGDIFQFLATELRVKLD